MRKLITSYLKKWSKMGYQGGIPDEAPLRLENAGRVPSYRLICLAIMKNDFTMQTLGFSRPGCELYGQLKRKELAEKGRKLRHEQLRLW